MRRYGKIGIKMLFQSLLITAAMLLHACSDNDSEPIPDPDPDPNPTLLKAKTFVFKDKSVLEFLKIRSSAGTEKLPSEDAAVYFGTRIEYSCPALVTLVGDSLFINRGSSNQESYKVKLEDNKLSLYNVYSGRWLINCGELNNDSLVLRKGFYRLESTDEKRTLSAIGQDYSLQSYMDVYNADAMKNDSTTLAWLRIQYVFEKQ